MSNTLSLPYYEQPETVSNKEMTPEKLEKIKRQLIFQYEFNLFANNKKKPVDIMGDDCFTNIHFVELLKNFFGKDLFKRYFNYTYYDPKNGTYNDELFKEEPNNQTLILLGSYTDINSIDPKIKEGKLFEIIKKTLSSDEDDKTKNNFVIGVCFGGHVCGMMSGHDVKPVTPHYKDVECHFTFDKDKETPQFYKDALRGIHQGNENTTFLMPGTNRQFLSLNSNGNKLHVLAEDEDGQIAIAGTENEKGLFIQLHPEINSASREVREQIHKILSKLGVDSEYLTQSYNETTNVGLSSYLPVLLESIKKINSKLTNDSVYDPLLKDRLGTIVGTGTTDPCDSGPDDSTSRKVIDILSIIDDIKNPKNNVRKLEEAAIRIITKIIGDKITCEVKKEIILGLFKSRDDFFVHNKEKLQEILFMFLLGVLNGDFNWSVSRSIEIASEILGFKDIHKLIHSVKDYLVKHGVLDEDEIFPVRDNGAGDLSLLMELIKRDKDDETFLYYGVGDRIYYKSFYNILLENFSDVPVQILKVITHKFFDTFNVLSEEYIDNVETSKSSLKEIIIESINNVSVEKDNEVGKFTMFGHDIKMNGYGDFEKLNAESISFLESDLFDSRVEDIKNLFRKDPLTIIDGFFHKMLISNFADIEKNLKNIDPLIANAFFQISIRSTSHINSEEYFSLHDTVIGEFLPEGGFNSDDGVFESFTFINRMDVLLKLKEKYGDGIDINVIYDPSTNYISSVIIQKYILGVTDKFDNQGHIRDDKKLVSIEEVNKSSFFKIENLYRKFIFNFFGKDKTVFWYFQDKILELVKYTILEIGEAEDIELVKNKLKLKLYKRILIMINSLDLPDEYSEGNIINAVENFFNSNSDINKIFEENLYIPEWQNINSNRKK